MSDINNERLAKFEGKCWHELKFDGTAMTRWIGPWACKHCGKRFEVGKPDNPDYSTSPADRERLWEYLLGRLDVWGDFQDWVEDIWFDDETWKRKSFIPWLFLPLDGVPRWVSMLSDWLGLEEVREKFGTTECEDSMVAYPDCVRINCNCSGSGIIRAEWAKV